MDVDGVDDGPIDLFDQSSQRRFWQFSADQLAHMRRELNEGAVKRVKLSLEEERAEAPKASTSALPPAPDDVEYLSVDDELSLVRFYLTRQALFSKAFKFSETVEATAATYLKRFYLYNTCMDYHPKLVMLTCLFLATKTENSGITIVDFAQKCKTEAKEILDLEFLVSQALKFQYKIHHAHVAARGIYYDLQTSSTDLERIHQAETAARDFIRGSRLTDAEFLYTPSQIALAAFSEAAPDLVEPWLQAKHERLRPSKTARLECDALLELLAAIREAVRSRPPEPGKNEVPPEVRAIDRRLQLCRNPEKNPASSLYKKRRAEAEAADKAKRQRKNAATLVDDEDPFSAPPSVPPSRALSELHPSPLSPAPVR